MLAPNPPNPVPAGFGAAPKSPPPVAPAAGCCAAWPKPKPVPAVDVFAAPKRPPPADGLAAAPKPPVAGGAGCPNPAYVSGKSAQRRERGRDGRTTEAGLCWLLLLLLLVVGGTEYGGLGSLLVVVSAEAAEASTTKHDGQRDKEEEGVFSLAGAVQRVENGGRAGGGDGGKLSSACGHARHAYTHPSGRARPVAREHSERTLLQAVRFFLAGCRRAPDMQAGRARESEMFRCDSQRAPSLLYPSAQAPCPCTVAYDVVFRHAMFISTPAATNRDHAA